METLSELRVPPGNRLEALSGDRMGQRSIRINDAVPNLFYVARLRTNCGGNCRLSLVDRIHWEKIMVRVPTDRAPTHPGEMLLEEFLQPLGIIQRELADAIQLFHISG